MRDHGGNIDAARARWGEGDWIDLSTGINRVPWPVPAMPPEAWTALPTQSLREACLGAARSAFGTDAPGVVLAGAQAAIQFLPRAWPVGTARILGPTYNEHAAAFRAAGWDVVEVGGLGDLAGADVAVVVNPNNPDGQRHAPEDLAQLARRVGRLIVDESFADPHPELSALPRAAAESLVVLRSFGKFWGLAGIRLGFAFGPVEDMARLAEMAGPWPVSGVALEIGRHALADRAWAEATRARLAGDVARLDTMAKSAGWSLVGGTALFRTYATPEARAAQEALAEAKIWTRVFPYSDSWIRLGLPGATAEWDRLASAVGG
jgi:cobalamin biosynthetic protein CobC